MLMAVNRDKPKYCVDPLLWSKLSVAYKQWCIRRGLISNYYCATQPSVSVIYNQQRPRKNTRKLLLHGLFWQLLMEIYTPLYQTVVHGLIERGFIVLVNRDRKENPSSYFQHFFFFLETSEYLSHLDQSHLCCRRKWLKNMRKTLTSKDSSSHWGAKCWANRFPTIPTITYANLLFKPNQLYLCSKQLLSGYINWTLCSTSIADISICPANLNSMTSLYVY